MKCAVCLMVKEGEAFDAITIRSGTAVCEHHISNVSDKNVSRVFETLPVWEGRITYQRDEDFE